MRLDLMETALLTMSGFLDLSSNKASAFIAMKVKGMFPRPTEDAPSLSSTP